MDIANAPAKFEDRALPVSETIVVEVLGVINPNLEEEEAVGGRK